MTQRTLSKPDKDELRNLIGNDVYVGSTRDDEIKCQHIWNGYVKEVSGGKYRGAIYGYNNHTDYNGKHVVGPDLKDKNPSTGIDQRMTWTLCVVDQKGRVVKWEGFLPQSKSINDDQYDFEDDLAQAVIDGKMTLAQAKKAAQEYAETIASQELEERIESTHFYDWIPKD